MAPSPRGSDRDSRSSDTLGPKQILPAKRPYIVVLGKEERKPTTINVAVPLDGNIKDKKTEMLSKLQDLKIELKRTKLCMTTTKVSSPRKCPYPRKSA
jgi:hypothetical protein